jgi:hypothetical protein
MFDAFAHDQVEVKATTKTPLHEVFKLISSHRSAGFSSLFILLHWSA